jgi:hypothetical protein
VNHHPDRIPLRQVAHLHLIRDNPQSPLDPGEYSRPRAPDRASQTIPAETRLRPSVLEHSGARRKICADALVSPNQLSNLEPGVGQAVSPAGAYFNVAKSLLSLSIRSFVARASRRAASPLVAPHGTGNREPGRTRLSQTP